MKSVLCVGVTVCDIPIENIPFSIFQRDKIDIETPVPCMGGDALNVANTLGKMGASAVLVGRVGDDTNGNFIRREAIMNGIDVSGLIIDTAHGTGVSYILIDENAERHFLCDARINNTLTADDVKDDQIEKSDIVYFGSAMLMEQMDTGGVNELFKRAHQYGKITAMDTAADEIKMNSENYLNMIRDSLHKTDIFMPSLEEAKAITGETKLRGVLKEFSKYNMKILVIKMGDKGCYLTDFKQCIQMDAFRQLPVVDTTGAEDSFVGAFLYAYMQEWDLETCGLFANAVAAHTVTSTGAASGVPKAMEALAFAEKYGGTLNINRMSFV